MNTIKFGDRIYPHTIGDPNCGGCRWGQPTNCPLCKEGLVHIEFNPKPIGNVFIFRCDQCAGLGERWKKPLNIEPDED